MSTNSRSLVCIILEMHATLHRHNKNSLRVLHKYLMTINKLRSYRYVVRATYQCSAQSCFFHLMLHRTSTLITTSISSHRLKYLTTNTHTWRQIQNLNWSRCSEYGVRNWRHTRICGGCQIPISAGTAFVQKRLWSTSLGLNCFRASVAGAMFNFLSSLIRCV
jgi:hypothetical protein